MRRTPDIPELAGMVDMLEILKILEKRLNIIEMSEDRQKMTGLSPDGCRKVAGRSPEGCQKVVKR